MHFISALLLGALTATAFKPLEAPLPEAGGALVVGEIHGSQEVPALFLVLVRDYVDKGGKPVVAVELPPSAGTLDCPATSQIGLSDYWRNSFQDGRTSKAMAQLVCALKPMAERGDVKLLFMDDVPRSASFDADATQRIASLLGKSSSHAFVLAGNFHTRNAPGSITGALRGYGVDTVSVTASAPTATVWAMTGTDREGRAQPFQANFCGTEPGSPVAFIALDTQKWDYCVNLPELTASPPAVDD